MKPLKASHINRSSIRLVPVWFPAVSNIGVNPITVTNKLQFLSILRVVLIVEFANIVKLAKPFAALSAWNNKSPTADIHSCGACYTVVCVNIFIPPVPMSMVGTYTRTVAFVLRLRYLLLHYIH